MAPRRHEPGHSTCTDAQESDALLMWIRTKRHAPGIEPQPERIIVHLAAASSRVQLDGICAWDVIPAENDVLNGIRPVSNGLNAGWLHIINRCQRPIGEDPRLLPGAQSNLGR